MTNMNVWEFVKIKTFEVTVKWVLEMLKTIWVKFLKNNNYCTVVVSKVPHYSYYILISILVNKMMIQSRFLIPALHFSKVYIYFKSLQV